MEVIIDDSFIMACMRKRIDFLKQLEEQGYTVKIPKEVLQELKDRRNAPTSSREDRAIIDTVMQTLDRTKVKHVSVGAQKIDDWLIEKGSNGAFIATTKATIKHKIGNIISIFESTGKVGPQIK